MFYTLKLCYEFRIKRNSISHLLLPHVHRRPKNYECYPSYKTIGKALKIKSKTTVAKYVAELEEKCLISTEPTEVVLKNGKKRNGNLKYKIRPIRDALEYNFKRQLKENAEKAAIDKAQKELEKYNKKHPKEPP